MYSKRSNRWTVWDTDPDTAAYPSQRWSSNKKAKVQQRAQKQGWRYASKYPRYLQCSFTRTEGHCTWNDLCRRSQDNGEPSGNVEAKSAQNFRGIRIPHNTSLWGVKDLLPRNCLNWWKTLCGGVPQWSDLLYGKKSNQCGIWWYILCHPKALYTALHDLFQNRQKIFSSSQFPHDG